MGTEGSCLGHPVPPGISPLLALGAGCPWLGAISPARCFCSLFVPARRSLILTASEWLLPFQITAQRGAPGGWVLPVSPSVAPGTGKERSSPGSSPSACLWGWDCHPRCHHGASRKPSGELVTSQPVSSPVWQHLDVKGEEREVWVLSQHHRSPPRARAKVGARGEGAFVPGHERVHNQALVTATPSL